MSWSASSTQASDQRVGAADQAKVVQGTGQYVESGATALKGSQNVGGLNIKTGKKSTVTIGATADDLQKLASNLGDTFSTATAAQAQSNSDLLNALEQSQSQSSGGLLDALNQQTSNLASTIKDSLSQLGSLGQTTQTGGVSQLNKTFLYLALAGFGLVALIFILGRKR